MSGSNTDGASGEVDDEAVAELAATLDGREDELRELLEVLTALQATAEDLAPEVRTAVRENREPLRDVRTAVEREEMVALLGQLGEHAEDLTELLELLETTEGLVADLGPELRRAVRENRDVLRRLRVAVENDDLVVLIERLGENADTLAEALELLDASAELAGDLMPEVKDAADDMRPAIRQLRMVTAGFADEMDERDVEPYEVGRNMGRLLAFSQQIGDPDLLDTLDAGLEGFTDDDPDEVGLFGLVGALRERNVRRGLGRVVEFLRRAGEA